MTIDCEPKLREIKGTDQQHVANMPLLIAEGPSGGAWYTYAGSDAWYAAPSIIGESPTVPPEIIVRTEPTELVVTDGPIAFSPLGTDLLAATNTESDPLLEIARQKHYVLLLGRWFRSLGLEGPWEFVASDSLPASFGDTPDDSELAHLLSRVRASPCTPSATARWRLSCRVVGR